MEILKKIAKLSADKNRQKEFIAPVISGNSVYVQISGFIMKLTPTDNKFEGWGRFAIKEKHADLVRNADFFEIVEYNEKLPKHDFILIKKLKNSSWLAFPKHIETFEKKYGDAKPLLVHLVENAQPLDEVEASFAGNFFYLDHKPIEVDIIDKMRHALKEATKPEELRICGATPTHKAVYGMLYTKIEEEDPRKRDEKKISRILKSANGSLDGLRESAKNTWTVEWRDSKGQRLTTTITKNHFRVNTAGYCLDHGDKDFDFQTVVNLKELRIIEQGY